MSPFFERKIGNIVEKAVVEALKLGVVPQKTFHFIRFEVLLQIYAKQTLKLVVRTNLRDNFVIFWIVW